MRIAFVGKGGSGKTTMSALFSRYLHSIGYPVLAIDGDINQHLKDSLSFIDADLEPLPSLGNDIGRLKEYVMGSNPLIQSAQDVLKTTPPGRGSKIMKFSEINPISQYFEKDINGIRFMATGDFLDEDLGVACYHSKTGAIELFLNHFIDGKHEYVVVDMTAGADAFASGLFSRFDVTFIMVEPTLKSLSVYEQYKKYATGHSVKLVAIGNKVQTVADETFLKDAIGEAFLASFHQSSWIQKHEQGIREPLTSLEEQNLSALMVMHDYVNTLEKNWNNYHAQSLFFHKRNCESWANAVMGKNLTDQIDPSFQYLTEVIAK